jgi:hypothetical protein
MLRVEAFREAGRGAPPATAGGDRRVGPPAAAAGEERLAVLEGVRLVAADVADDPALPGLRAVLAAGAEIVRYHPRRRCTVRDGERFGKVGAGGELLAKQQLLWAHRHELGFAVAEPLGYDEATRTLWLGAVPGGPVPLDAALAERMGAALATLARSRLRPPPRAPARDAARELIRRVPALRARVEALATGVRPGPPRPVHGAPHPPQWLMSGDGLGLIDFDKLALGDPEADVAAFMEAAAAEDGGEAVAAAFAAGYGPLDRDRLAAYRTERRVLKALRAASALRPDGDERAARRLRGAGAP